MKKKEIASNISIADSLIAQVNDNLGFFNGIRKISFSNSAGVAISLGLAPMLLLIRNHKSQRSALVMLQGNTVGLIGGNAESTPLTGFSPEYNNATYTPADNDTYTAFIVSLR